MTFYSFDTSSLLNGQRDLLPPEVFPSMWDNLQVLIGSGDVRCVDVVREELGRRDDDVAAWARSQTGLFVPLEPDVQVATRNVLSAHPQLVGQGGGRNAADPFVIGLAVARGGVVVTEETLRGRIDKPKIPDVCDALGVPWMNLVGFVRTQGWRF